LAFLLHSGPAFSAINTDIALNPAKGQTILRTQYSRTRKGDDPTDQNRSMTVDAVKLVVVMESPSQPRGSWRCHTLTKICVP